MERFLKLLISSFILAQQGFSLFLRLEVIKEWIIFPLLRFPKNKWKWNLSLVKLNSACRFVFFFHSQCSPMGIFQSHIKGQWLSCENADFKWPQMRVKSWRGFEKIARKVWKGITPKYLKRLYESMPRQMQVVIAADRGHTKKWWQ